MHQHWLVLVIFLVDQQESLLCSVQQQLKQNTKAAIEPLRRSNGLLESLFSMSCASVSEMNEPASGHISGPYRLHVDL